MYETAFHKQDLSNLKFLVTGGAGFIGSHIVQYLLKYGAKVRVLDNLLTGFQRNVDLFAAHPNYEFIHGDITDAETCAKACKDIDYVSHQAALGSVPRSIKNPQNTHNINVNGFLNMLIAARDAKVQRMVFASSSSVYGDSPDLPKVETKIGKPLSPYAVTKYTNEIYAHVFAHVYGMPVLGFRYFNVFGPRQDPDGVYAAVIPLFIKKMLNNESPMIDGDGLQTRDFTFVENAVQANIRGMLAENEECCDKIYNVAVGKNYSVLDMVNELKKIIGTDINATHRETRSGDIRNSLADISQAKKYLSYEPTVYFSDGLHQTVNFFKQK